MKITWIGLGKAGVRVGKDFLFLAITCAGLGAMYTLGAGDTVTSLLPPGTQLDGIRVFGRGIYLSAWILLLALVISGAAAGLGYVAARLIKRRKVKG